MTSITQRCLARFIFLLGVSVRVFESQGFGMKVEVQGLCVRLSAQLWCSRKHLVSPAKQLGTPDLGRFWAYGLRV